MFNQKNNYEIDVSGQSELSAYVSSVYGWMFFGLLITAVISFVVATSQAAQSLFLSPTILIASMIAEVVLVIVFSVRIRKLAFSTALMIFLVYSALNGINIGALLLVYGLGAAFKAFLVTSLAFGSMAIYGRVTNTDMTKLGGIAMFGLIGIIIASLLNLLFRSSALDYIISFIGIGIFMILTARDSQNIKNIFYGTENDEQLRNNYAISSALSLYLDFINIFIFLLRIFGGSRR